jgi:hypothetical protein
MTMNFGLTVHNPCSTTSFVAAASMTLSANISVQLIQNLFLADAASDASGIPTLCGERTYTLQGHPSAFVTYIAVNDAL